MWGNSSKSKLMGCLASVKVLDEWILGKCGSPKQVSSARWVNLGQVEVLTIKLSKRKAWQGGWIRGSLDSEAR